MVPSLGYTSRLPDDKPGQGEDCRRNTCAIFDAKDTRPARLHGPSGMSEKMKLYHMDDRSECGEGAQGGQ